MLVVLQPVVEKKIAGVELRFYRFPGALLALGAERCQGAGDAADLLHRPVGLRRESDLPPPAFRRGADFAVHGNYSGATANEANQNLISTFSREFIYTTAAKHV